MAVLVSQSRPMGEAEILPWFDSINQATQTGSNPSSGSSEIPVDQGDELSKATTEFIYNSKSKDFLFSDELKADKQDRLLFLSISDLNSAPHIFLGRGKGLLQAWKIAIEQSTTMLEGGFQVRRARIDIVDTLRSRDPGEESPLMIPGIDGLAFDRHSKLVILPGQLVANRLLSEDGRLLKTKILKYIRKISGSSDSYVPFKLSEGYIFTTKAWLITSSGTKRLRAISDPRPNLPTTFQLTKNILHFSQQLLSYQKPIGNFPTDQEDSAMATQGFAIWSLLQPVDEKIDSKLIRATRLGVDFILRNSKPCRGKGTGYLCIDEGANLISRNGYAALAIGAYIEKTGNRSLIPQLRKIMRSLKDEIKIRFSALPGGRLVSNSKQLEKTANEFAVGLYALLKIFQLDPSRVWLNPAIDLAGRMLRYKNTQELLDSLDNNMWLSLGLERLYRETGDPSYQIFLQKIADLTIKNQIVVHQRPEWIGGFEPKLISSYTAAQMISLVAASSVINDQVRLDKIDNSVKLAVRNLLGFRLKPDAALYYDEPSVVVNRLKKSHFNNATSSEGLASGLIALYLYSGYLQGSKLLGD